MPEQSAFEVVAPLVKASRGPRGQTWVHGVACDETLDLQREVTLASDLRGSLDYLRKFGRFSD